MKKKKTKEDIVVNQDNIKKVLSSAKAKLKKVIKDESESDDEQGENNGKVNWRETWKRNFAPYMYKAGQSGNPNGRPKGKTLKEYTRDKLAAMTDDEREIFMEGLPKEIIWKMAEGMPEQSNKLSGPNGEPLFNDEHKTKARGAVKKYLDRANSR